MMSLLIYLVTKSVTKLFIRGRKLIAFITKPCFAVSKTIMLNSTHYFVIKIPKCESLNKLQLIISQILTLKTLCIFKKGAVKKDSFLKTDTTLVSDNHLGFRCNLSETI